MRIIINKNNNGIYSCCEVAAEDIESNDLKLLSEIVKVTTKFNKTEIKES